MFDLEREVAAWRGALAAKGALSVDGLEELETHLRDEIADLTSVGLDGEEAFLIAIKRVGNLDSMAKEFAKTTHSELWKNMTIVPQGAEAKAEAKRTIGYTLLLVFLAALSSKIPQLLLPMGDERILLTLRLASFFFIPFIGLYLMIQRRLKIRSLVIGMLIYLAFGVILTLYPLRESRDTTLLAIIHTPIFLWIGTVMAYCGSEVVDPRRRMDFVRYSGEAFLFGVLLACGVAVFTGFVSMLFTSLGIDTERLATEWIVPMGMSAAGVGAGIIAKTKRNVIENFAPVLAKIFVPLFLFALVGFIVIMAGRGIDPFADRNMLISFDLMLALVVALVLYTLSARDSKKAASLEDWLSLALLLAALVIDFFALRALGARLYEYGASPNKMAALGENLILFVDLAGLGICYIAFLMRKWSIDQAIRWQTAFFIPIFLWALGVCFAFPLIFAFQ